MTLMLPGLELDGFAPTPLTEANALLARAHYLGPTAAARHTLGVWSAGELVAAQCWRLPASRRLPADGSWLELSRWCLTPEAGPNAGSRMHAQTVRWLCRNAPEVTTLVSYSDPSAGHSGALYKACNWLWAPTWHRLRPPPSGNGAWAEDDGQAVKDRWVFPLRPDPRRAELLRCVDLAAVRFWLGAGGDLEAIPAEWRPQLTPLVTRS